MRMLLFPPRPENKPNGQIFLVFCLKKFLVKVCCSDLTHNLLHQRKTHLGKMIPGASLTHVCFSILGSGPERPAQHRDYIALFFPSFNLLSSKSFLFFSWFFYFSVENWPSSHFFLTSGNSVSFVPL